MVLEPDNSEFKFHIYHILAARPWASYLGSIHPHFPYL